MPTPPSCINVRYDTIDLGGRAEPDLANLRRNEDFDFESRTILPKANERKRDWFGVLIEASFGDHSLVARLSYISCIRALVQSVETVHFIWSTCPASGIFSKNRYSRSHSFTSSALYKSLLVTCARTTDLLSFGYRPVAAIFRTVILLARFSLGLILKVGNTEVNFRFSILRHLLLRNRPFYIFLFEVGRSLIASH